MAGRPISFVDRLAPGGELLVDRERIFRRRQRPQPVRNSLNSWQVNRDWGNARPKGSALVALVDRGVVAIPVQVHAFTIFLVPYRRKIGSTNQFRRGKFVHGKVKFQSLVRVEGINPSGPPRRSQ